MQIERSSLMSDPQSALISPTSDIGFCGGAKKLSMPDESLNSDWSVYNHCSGKPSVQENHSEPALLSDAAMRGTAESPGSITSIPQARQRRRVAVACNECRVKKTRCDGRRPVCSLCESQGASCGYARTLNAAGNLVSSQPILNDLESRLARVEAELYDMKHGQIVVNSDESCFMDHEQEPLSMLLLQQEGESDASPDITDGVGSIEFTNVPRIGYFGPSSNIHFVRSLRNGLTSVLSQVQSRTEDAHGLSSLNGIGSSNNVLDASRPVSPTPPVDSRPAPVSHNVNMTQPLESPQAVEKLIDQYFLDTGQLFPFIHEQSFRKTYEESRALGFAKARRSFIALLFGILSMATFTTAKANTSLEQKASIAKPFFARAKQLCIADTLAGGSVETVQALLLISQFLQGTKGSVQTWSIHGLAVKAALQLGLQSEAFGQEFSPLEQEVRKRTWLGCVILDRTLSLTLGRPTIIPERYVQFSLPVHVFNELHSDSWSENEPSTQFFIATIELYQIMSRAIDLLYGSNVGSTTKLGEFELASAMLDLGHQLHTWHQSLSRSLCLIEADDLANSVRAGGLLLRLRIILTLRYHNVFLLINRPILDHCISKLVDEVASNRDRERNTHSTLESLPNLSNILSSTKSIIDIVGFLVSKNAEHNYKGFLGAWWFSLYYTFNATLTAAASFMCLYGANAAMYQVSAILNQQTLLHETSNIVQQAARCLPLIDAENQMVQKCAKMALSLGKVLQLLLKSKESRQQGRGPSNTTAFNYGGGLASYLETHHPVTTMGSTGFNEWDTTENEEDVWSLINDTFALDGVTFMLDDTM